MVIFFSSEIILIRSSFKETGDYFMGFFFFNYDDTAQLMKQFVIIKKCNQYCIKKGYNVLDSLPGSKLCKIYLNLTSTLKKTILYYNHTILVSMHFTSQIYINLQRIDVTFSRI